MRKAYLPALGIINALGSSKAEILQRLLRADRSAFRIRTDLIPGQECLVAPVAEELPEIPSRLAHLGSRSAQLLHAAYEQIAPQIEQALSRFGKSRVGVVLGTSTAGIDVGERGVEMLLKRGEFPEDYLYSRQEPGALSAYLAGLIGSTGPEYTISTACSSSAKVFASARNLLRSGMADAVLVGGADCLCRLTLNGFSVLELISKSACNPFSKARSGITIGEGAALFLMTREPTEIALCGVGESSDAYHFSAPDPDGCGAELAMSRALNDSGLLPEDISYVNLHGTGTAQNDAMESKALLRVFRQDVPSSSTKALTGHTLGACGAIEAGICWLCLDAGKGGRSLPLPPHCYDGVMDDALPRLNLVPSGMKSAYGPKGAYMVSNSFAFGGSNCSVIIGRGFEA